MMGVLLGMMGEKKVESRTEKDKSELKCGNRQLPAPSWSPNTKLWRATARGAPFRSTT